MSDFDLDPFPDAPPPPKPPTRVPGVFLILIGLFGMLAPTFVRLVERPAAQEQLRLFEEDPEERAALVEFWSDVLDDEEEAEQMVLDFEDGVTRVAAGQQSTIPTPWLLTLLVGSGLTLLGGIGMFKRAWWGVCVGGAVATFLPCVGPCCGLFFPIGIWSLIVLYQRDTRAGFEG